MIHRTQMTFTAWGEHFMPSKVSAPFSEAYDPGSTGRTGRYRGIPTPYGSASFDVTEEEAEKISHLHRLVVTLLPALREAGATEFWLRITYHADSGALGFSKEDIRMLAEMECDVPIDCLLEEAQQDETQQPPLPALSATSPVI